MLEAKKIYVLKQADGTLWSFTYKDNFGIIYRTFDKNLWSTYNILVKSSSKAFSALILPDNKICVIYQSSFGNLLLKVYSQNEWKEYSILQKKNNNINDIYFKTIYALGKIQIFYSILQPHDNTRTLFHQSLTLNDNLSVSSPILIDTTNVNHSNQFVVHEINPSSICIMYQKLVNKYELGYRVYDDNSTSWSKFNNIDKNFSPYIDYSLNTINDKPNVLYIKNNGEISTLYNYTGHMLTLEHTKLAESNNISSCAFFKENDINYSFWISNSYIYSCYTSDTNTNISPIKSEVLKSANIFKASYIEISSEKQYLSNDLYVQDGTDLVIIPSNFFTYREVLKKKQNKLVSDMEKGALDSYSKMNLKHSSIQDNTEGKTRDVENKLTKKDQIINQLNYIIKEERKKVLLLNNKINIIEKDYIDLEKEKSQLYKDINSLQEALIIKEKRINELEKTIIEKETKSISLNDTLNKYNNNLEYNKQNSEMEIQIEEYKSSIAKLNKTIERLDSEIHALEKENERVAQVESKNEEYKKKIDDLNKLNERLAVKVVSLEDYNNKIPILESKADEYEILIENLNKTIESLNFKISTLEEEKLTLINEKNNSSLFRKLFNS